jgi:hypothetical protein
LPRNLHGRLLGASPIDCSQIHTLLKSKFNKQVRRLEPGTPGKAEVEAKPITLSAVTTDTEHREKIACRRQRIPLRRQPHPDP